MGKNTNEEWVKIVDEYDDNGDGEISYQEFLNIIDKILMWFNEKLLFFLIVFFSIFEIYKILFKFYLNFI